MWEKDIPDSKLTLYQTTASLLEKNSVKWLDNLFNRPELRTNFSIEDKKPNIDGTFDILKNNRFDGRFEVQIKTYNGKSSRYKPQYVCDIKLLFYALKNRPSCILLFVVDQSNNKAYWKYLNELYIKGLKIKEQQKKITIRFNEEEYVNEINFYQCLNKWHSFYQVKANGIFFDDCSIEESKQKINEITRYFDNIRISSLKKDDIIRIQKFIDRFNTLLDGDYNFIKRFFYPEMWKIGIAIGTYTLTSLTYVLYPVFWGSNDLILKKIKLQNFSEVDHFFGYNFLMAVINNNKNPIISGNPDIIMDHINDKIKDIIERKKFLFLTIEIAIEHIYDALQENFSFWKIGYDNSVCLEALKEHLENNYQDRINTNVVQLGSQSNSNLSTVYQCVIYLLTNNIQEINRIFPIMPRETEASFIDTLFYKLETVFLLMPTTFDAYMYYAFPSLKNRITFWNGYDLISINLLTTKNNYFIAIHYFRRTDGTGTTPQLIITRDLKHELYKGFSWQGAYSKEFFTSKFSLNGLSYRLCVIEGDNYHRIIRKYSIHNQLYKFLGRRFNNYLKPDKRISQIAFD
jgi:hypothetical protein